MRRWTPRSGRWTLPRSLPCRWWTRPFVPYPLPTVTASAGQPTQGARAPAGVSDGLDVRVPGAVGQGDQQVAVLSALRLVGDHQASGLEVAAGAAGQEHR